MAGGFARRMFTGRVKEAQVRYGSRADAARMEAGGGDDRLGEKERRFIAERDGFYLATVNEEGWPYVQFRGGPRGFLRVVDDRTLGYADFRGNLQYISMGNLRHDDRVALFLMDYANRRRLKILARARVVDVRDDPGLVARLEDPRYRARVERGVLLALEAFDWNCPQHITPRFTEEEWRERERAASEAPDR
jgi:predicted pyridoxine 5'-phosphate oxidase superfamily flavin-nucleotide-binding protein